jgi:uncharacterized membrane protein YphA (DoxX/SURF4 family)
VATLIFFTWVFALLLMVAGARKITRPAATRTALRTARLPSHESLARMLGVGEVGLGVAVLVDGGPVATALLALSYLAFAVFAEHQRRRNAGCGCLGASTTPVTQVHVGLNVVVAVIAAAATVAPRTSLVTTITGGPLPGLMLAALLMIAAGLFHLLLTAAPDLSAAMALSDAKDDT